MLKFWLARKLRELKHTGTIREYVKQFAGLMLDISDMTKNDKIFNFVEGLKSWARTKLYERVQDLASANATVEHLFDLFSDAQETRRHQSSSPRRDRNNWPNSSKAVSGNRSLGRDCKPSQPNTRNTWRRPNGQRSSHIPISCYICNGPHRARECPDKSHYMPFMPLWLRTQRTSWVTREGRCTSGGSPKYQIGGHKTLVVSP